MSGGRNAGTVMRDRSGRPSRGERLHRALNYPYHWPRHCFLYHDGRAHPVDNREARREGRVPVLAYGSNRSPEQLARKFGDVEPGRAILVERCEIGGFDVVHSAHVASYGAIPAALHSHRDVTVSVAVTWLDRRQLAAMDVSERAGRNYGRETLGTAARLGDGAVSDAVQAYLTSHGPLTIAARVVSHADVDARGRQGPGLRNIDILVRAQRAFAPALAFETFVLRLADDNTFRQRITERLKEGLDDEGVEPGEPDQ